MFIELGKDMVRKFYNDSIRDAIQNQDYIEWDDERIKKAFNNGCGTIKDFKNYMNNNKKYCYFKEIE